MATNINKSFEGNSLLWKLGLAIGGVITVFVVGVSVSIEFNRLNEIIKGLVNGWVTIASVGILSVLIIIYFYAYNLYERDAFYLFIAFSWLCNLFYMIFITGWFNERTATLLFLQILLSFLSDLYLYLANSVSDKNVFKLKSLIIPGLFLLIWFPFYYSSYFLELFSLESKLRILYFFSPLYAFYVLLLTGITIDKKFETNSSTFPKILSLTFKFYAGLQLSFILIAFDLSLREDGVVVLSQTVVLIIYYVTSFSILLKAVNGGTLALLLRDKFAKLIEEKTNANTGLKFANEQLKKEELKKKEFEDLFLVTSSIEHELRNPLSVVINTIIGLRKKYTSNEQLLKKIEKINNSCKGMQVAVELVKIIRYTDEQISFILKEINLGKLLHSVQKKVQTEFENKIPNISIKVDEKKQNLKINGVADLLEKVFINLTKNSIESMMNTIEKDGTVFLELTTDDEDNRKIVITVRDNGIGFRDDNGELLSHEEINKVIHPSYSTRKDSSSNHGIGLFISEKIIKLHKGEMILKNLEDGGAEVSVILDRVF